MKAKTAQPERTYLTSDGRRVSREAYAKYLRECAARWRAQPVLCGNPTTAAFKRRLLEQQAVRVEERAAKLERGEED